MAEQISKGPGKVGAKFTSFKKVDVRHHSKLYFRFQSIAKVRYSAVTLLKRNEVNSSSVSLEILRK